MGDEVRLTAGSSAKAVSRRITVIYIKIWRAAPVRQNADEECDTIIAESACAPRQPQAMTQIPHSTGGNILFLFVPCIAAEWGNTMEIRARDTDRELLLELSGDIDHHGARNALKEVEMTIDAALPRLLILELSGVTFMDSSGIALILRTQQRMQLLEGSVVLRGVPDQARRVLDAAGIGRLVSIQ